MKPKYLQVLLMIINSRDKITLFQQGKMKENENRKDQLKASLSWVASQLKYNYFGKGWI